MKQKIFIAAICTFTALSFFNTFLFSATLEKTQDEQQVDIAIIGCGVSGTYCAAKIAQKYPEKKIVLYDVAERIGGRLLSIHLPDMPHVPVEMSAMRFSSSHQRVNHLVQQLGLPTHSFSGKTKDAKLYLRGVHLNESDLTNPKKIPYHLSKTEEGKTPHQILIDAVKVVIPEIEKLTIEEWLKKRDHYQWKGKPLEKLSWQQLLAENMSDEAFQLLIDLGYIQLIAEVSVYTQLGDLLEKSEGPPQAISIGFQSLPEKLAVIAKQKGVEIELETKLIRVDQKENGDHQLTFQPVNGMEKSVYAKNIISTLSPPALLHLWEASPYLQKLVKKDNLNLFWINPLTKLFFAYRSPWWRDLDLYDGSATTTLPLRNIFYFGTESEAYGGEKDNNNALLLASYQGAFAPFWHTTAERIAPATHRNHYRPDDEAIWFGQFFLKKVYGLEDIPTPYAAAFMNWDRPPHFGGYFFWKIGVKPMEWYEKYSQLGDKSGFFLAGSPYSTKPGWIEGSLETCDKLLFRYFQINEDDKITFKAL